LPTIASVKYAGTGGGFKRFVTGEIDICDASRPIQAGEMEKSREHGVEYIELPIAFDAITVAVNVENKWCDAMTVEELKTVWEPGSKITRWNQIRSEWPDEEIHLFGAGTDSGTFEYFTEAIVGKKNASRSDYTAQENDNIIVQGIQGDKFALGYVPYAYYEPQQQTLKAVKIDWEKDEQGPVEPTVENVVNSVYNPLSRPLFIYVLRSSADKPHVQSFVEFFVTHGEAIAQDVRYIPLPADAYPKVLERFQKRETGTAFGGHSEVGLHIDEILSREPQQ
jgi:phosphate transport system substrate-binding protein